MKPVGYMFFPDAPPLPIHNWETAKEAIRPDAYMWARNSMLYETQWFAGEYFTLTHNEDVPCEYRALLLLLD